MTPQTQCTDVLEIALAAALGHRHNMVRIPQGPACARLQSPVLQQLRPPCTARRPQPSRFRHRIYTASRADATIALEYLFAHIPRLRPQLPLVHTILRAECEPPSGHLQRAPPANTAPVRPSRNRLPVNPSSPHYPLNAHLLVLHADAVTDQPYANSPHQTHQPVVRFQPTAIVLNVQFPWPSVPYPFVPCSHGAVSLYPRVPRSLPPGTLLRNPRISSFRESVHILAAAYPGDSCPRHRIGGRCCPHTPDYARFRPPRR